ncbi:MAG: hypothetical protein ACI4ET_03635 [Bilifractor sp.]
MAEIIYTNPEQDNQDEFCIRKAPAGEEQDISGDYNEYTESKVLKNIDWPITVYYDNEPESEVSNSDGTTVRYVRKALWSAQGYSFSMIVDRDCGFQDEDVIRLVNAIKNGDDEEIAAAQCKEYITARSDNEPQTITNWNAPEVTTVEELPEDYWKISDVEGTGPYYKITFTTTDDAILGPIVYYVNQEGYVVGSDYRD